MKTKITTLALAATLLLSTNLKAQDGSLDLSFNIDGKVVTNVGSANSIVKAISIQPDGKILAAGYCPNGNGQSYDFALVRYNSDGSLDLSFDTDGKVTLDIGSSNDHAFAMCLQPDGKILLAGDSYNITNDFALVRYNSDGSLDLSFDTDGIVTTPIGSAWDMAYAMSLQPDGKILLVGYSIATDSDFALVRYNTDGSLDLSFDTDGIVTTNIEGNDEAYAVRLQSDGKILVAGRSVSLITDRDFALVRYNSDGSLDLSFDTDGIVTTNIGNSSDQANAMSLQPDGKILLAGFSETPTGHNFALVRYNNDGSLDLSFDTDGKITTLIGSGGDDAYSINLQPDGKILLAGNSDNGQNYDFTLVRYHSDGSLDLGFDADGIVTTPIRSGADGAFAACLQPDGKILLAGYSYSGTNCDFALTRYNNTITSINTIEEQTPTMTIYPNPFKDATTIQFPLTTTDAELSIYNIFGQKVKTISNISDTKISLNRDELSSGFYVLRLTQNKKVVATGKMVVVD